MYQEIQRRKVELQSGRPYSRQTSEQIKALNVLDYICCGMLLDGDELSREEIQGMINGEMPRQASLKQCLMVRNYLGLMDVIQDSLDLKCNLDSKLLLKFYEMLTGQSSGFRSSNFMALDFKHVPPHHTEIESKLNLLLRNIYKSTDNEIKNAAMLHCGIMAIYPFGEDSGIMARLAMNYYLQEKGFLPVALGYNYDEYMSTMTQCFKDDSIAVFFWGLERAEFNKLDHVLQIIESEE